MKTIPLPDPDTTENDDTVAFVDWKDSPETVLESVDGLLEPFGLEIVQYDTQADDHLFRIVKRPAP